MSSLTTALVEGADARLELDGAELKVVAGPDRGTKVTLSADSLTIGSADSCDLVLHDSTVSSRHAELVVTDRGYVVRDLGSTNGIFLGSQPIERAPVIDGMKLRLGGSTLQVRAVGDRVTVPLARAAPFHGLVGKSLKMRALIAQLERIAPTDVTVLISGETGTGKEVIAAALHAASARAQGPLVVCDCGALVTQLAVAQLFGHERGAFTGADRAHAGLFEQAEGGTLFLDEIGELPLELQPLLLGALERKRTRRVGGREEIQHDVRVIAATHRNLAEDVRQGRFRQDLYHRIAVTRVHAPPLRERREDIVTLADLFARESHVTLAPETLVPLKAYDWPGNVRELRNVVARMAIHPEGALESAAQDSIFLSGDALRALPEARRMSADAFERDYLERALAIADGNLTRASELAGISLRVMQTLAAKHGVRTRR